MLQKVPYHSSVLVPGAVLLGINLFNKNSTHNVDTEFFYVLRVQTFPILAQLEV